MPSGPGSTPAPTLADRLDRLFRTVRKRDEETGELREYSLREAADAITAAGTAISFSYIGLLRSGKKDNVDLKRLLGLADFFGVPVEYFTSGRVAEEVDYELDLVAALQELRARRIALRDSVLAEALADARQTTQAFTEVMRRIEAMERGRDLPWPRG